jgi:uncharacterized membrane protein
MPAPAPVAAPPASPPYRALPRLARGVFLFVGALPWWIPVARARLNLGDLGRLLDATFVSMCHRLPERSLALGGVVMPVCSRCAGIFAGLAIGAVIARPRLSMATWRRVILAVAAVMVLDVVTQDLGLRPLWHPARLGTGVVLGYCMVVSFITHLAPDRR